MDVMKSAIRRRILSAFSLLLSPRKTSSFLMMKYPKAGVVSNFSPPFEEVLAEANAFATHYSGGQLSKEISLSAGHPLWRN
jgi:hypothetical protein